jgi:AcrR family transcriptional regulator
VTVAAVARRLEVRTPSLYSHVGGSSDLAVRVCARALDELADLVTSAVTGRSGRAALHALLDAHSDFGHRHPGRYAALRLRLPSAGDPDGPDAAVSAALRAGRRHADLLRAVLRDYGLSGDAETHAVRLLGSVVQGYATLDLAGSFGHSEPPAEETRRYIIEAVDAVLRTQASSGTPASRRPSSSAERRP